MKINIKHHIGYGLIPSISIITCFYAYAISFSLHNYIPYMIPLSFMFIFGVILYILLKKIWSLKNILFYIGYKFLPIHKVTIYFSSYYLVLLSGLYLINKNSFNHIHSYVLIAVPIIFLIVANIFLKNAQIVVKFIRVSPRIYMDAINYEFYTKNDIENLDVMSMIDEELPFRKLLGAYQFYLKQDSKKYDFYSDKIEYVEYEYFENSHSLEIIGLNEKEEVIWEVTVKLDKNETYDEDMYGELMEGIVYIENL